MARIGIIGTGWGARVQVPAFREAGLEVVALAGSHRNKTQRVANEMGLVAHDEWPGEVGELQPMTQFSRHGDEIAWGTIGNASCAEGMFWESINAGGVLQIPFSAARASRRRRPSAARTATRRSSP